MDRLVEAGLWKHKDFVTGYKNLGKEVWDFKQKPEGFTKRDTFVSWKQIMPNRIYQGEGVMGIPDGRGIEIYKDAYMLIGFFKNGLPQGPVAQIQKSGVIMSGTMDRAQFKGPVEVTELNNEKKMFQVN